MKIITEEDAAEYLFNNLIDLGFVPSDEEIEVLAEIVIDFILYTFWLEDDE